MLTGPKTRGYNDLTMKRIERMFVGWFLLRPLAFGSGQALRQSSGQAGIVILLLTIVLLTVGLSIASRSVTDVRLSRQEEETSRAFDAAEAGIEDALRKDLAGLVGVGGSVDVGPCPGPECIRADYSVNEEVNLETELEEGETVEVNLAGFTGSGVTLQWGRSGEVCSGGDLFASLVVAVFDNTGKVRRTPYSQIGCNRGDSFVQSAGPAAAPYLLRLTENVGPGDIALRARAVYSDTPIRVESSSPGTNPLPAQFWRVHSEAKTTGGETRAVEVTQTSPAPPSLFDFVIFSGGNLENN